MKKGRLFILIYAMLICLASVGCGVKENVSEIEENVSEIKEDIFPNNLDDYEWSNANILLKYSDKKVIVYSDKTCFFDLWIRTKDSDFKSSNYYRGIEISEGETLELTLEDLAPGFFSDDTLISDCSEDIKPYVEK